jgi:2-dehydropantoate 2-reductase
MRWLIVGAGGIGGYFGARLVEAGRDVSFLLRERRAAQIRAKGLVIRSAQGDFTAPQPRIVTSETLRERFDCILVACKSYDLESSMDAIAPAVGNGTTILPLLNGMRHLDALGERFGKEKVLGGHCMISAAIAADGAIEHYSELHHLTFGELDGSRTPRVAAIEQDLSGTKFTMQGSEQIVQEMWEKWIFIASMGCANSLMRADIGDIVDAGGTDFTLGLYAEACAIAKAHGHDPRPAAIERATGILTQRESRLMASLLRDVEAGGKTEAEHIVGDLVARGGDQVRHWSLMRLALLHLRAHAIRVQRERLQPQP